jgi:hypothetical protein
MSVSVSAARCVARAMERIAPLSLAEKWDNVCLLYILNTKTTFA